MLLSEEVREGKYHEWLAMPEAEPHIKLANKIAELEQELGETNEALAACQSEAGGVLKQLDSCLYELQRTDENQADMTHYQQGIAEGREQEREECIEAVMNADPTTCKDTMITNKFYADAIRGREE